MLEPYIILLADRREVVIVAHSWGSACQHAADYYQMTPIAWRYLRAGWTSVPALPIETSKTDRAA